MLIKSIDEKGNRAVGNYPDNSNFTIEQDSGDLCYIAAHLPDQFHHRLSQCKEWLVL